jgi:F0F1-type ATP synthase membrane subunit b/b'
VSPSLSTFLLEAANFLILASGLGWLFFRPVRNAIAREQAAHREAEAHAAAQRAEADRLRAQVEAERAGLAAELAATRAEAKKAAEAEARELRARATHEAEEERARTRRELSSERRASTAAIGGDIASLSAKALLDLFSWLEGPELEVALTRAAIRALGGVAAGTRIVVESGGPLPDAARQALIEALPEARLELRVREALGVGVRLLTPDGLVDASASGLSEHARRSVERSLTETLSEGDGAKTSATVRDEARAESAHG